MQQPHEPIAIVGLSCIFPCASGADAFWDLLRSGGCAIRDVPSDRWDGSALYDPDPSAPGRILTRHGGFIDEAALFDPEFFGLSAREARSMDPRQRLALKTAWWALEHANIPGWSLKGRAGGVFLGATNGEFGGVHADLAAIGPHTGTGQATSILANRISYQLGLIGPSMVIDTACSSSLIAVHLASASLRGGECDFALAGGVSLILRPDASVAFSRARMLAADGRCKPFSADADGYGRGEGAGMVVLKRLADAERDGNRILGVIMGSAVNHNGQSNGIAAPSTSAQDTLIRQALAASGVEAADIDYVEAHGTGTLLGDPIEARALGQVFGRAAGRIAALPIGSVKSNIGHLEGAAGIAGLIKLTLALYNRVIPPSLGFAAPNPHIDFQGLNLVVPTSTQALPDRGRPAVGAVSSFGFGGANCHMIVAAAREPNREVPSARWPQVLTLSATSAPALDRMVDAMVARLRAAPDAAAALCVVSHTARSAMRHRISFAASDAEGLLAALDKNGVRKEAPRRPPMLAFLFSGQGAQFPGMARDLVDRHPIVRDALAEAAELTGLPLLDLIRDSAEQVNQTEFTQPLMMALQVGLARLWSSWGIEPAIVIGHSLGDYAAAVVAGALDFADAVRLLAVRGRLMMQHALPGGMATVAASDETIGPYLAPGCVIAIRNGPESLTIAGAEPALAESVRRLGAVGISVRPLNVSAAFHSPAMDPVLEPFRAALADVTFHPLRLPMVCNRTGRVLPKDTCLDADFWLAHLRDPVGFTDGVTALAAAGTGLGLEIGPAAVLSRIAPLSASDLTVVPSLIQGKNDGECLAAALGQLWCAGGAPDWNAIDGPTRAFAELPLYSFDETVFPLLAEGTVPKGAALTIPVTHVSQALPSRVSSRSVLDRLRGIVADLLETSPDRVDINVPFLEMGADSLVLITAASRIEAMFGVKLPIRSFFEELSTLAALAAHLSLLEAPADEATGVDAAPDSFVEQVVREQLDMMRRQLNLLEGRTPGVRPKALAQPVRPSRVTAQTDTLDVRQRAHLDALIRDYTKRTAGSKALAERARPVMADSRASAGFRLSIKEMLYPIVCRSAAGTMFEDVDGNRYLDISMGFGVQLFGHMPGFLSAALHESLAKGIRIGPQSDRAGEVAERIARLSGQDRVAFLNSGTEAVMVALRLARTVTGRDKVVIFRGAYHGHADGILAEDEGVPLVPGVTSGSVADVLVLDYGTDESLAALAPILREVAAVLVEPVQSRRPDLQPGDFLKRLGAMTGGAGALLVFDELITGFRIAPGGAQEYFGVKADLVAYGKVLGGGLPIGVLAGRTDVMAAIDGGIWAYGDNSAPMAETTLFAGTFNKNPLTIDAALAVLTEIERQGDSLYEGLNRRAEGLAARLTAALVGTTIRVVRFGSMFRFAFSGNLDVFFYHLLLRGIYIWEGRTCFLSTAHTDADCDRLVAAVEETVAALRSGGFFDPADAAPESVEMILAQRQLAALASLDDAGAAAYSLPIMIDLDGTVDVARLNEAIAQVAARHDSLWASMDVLNGRLSFGVPGRLGLEVLSISEDELNLAVKRRLSTPFKLASPPFLRATLFDLGGERSVLLLVGHHAAVDGLSLQVLVAEIAVLYTRRSLPTSISYRALMDGQARANVDGYWTRARDWWMNHLHDAPGGLDLDLAAPRPPVRAFDGGRVIRDLPPDLSDALRARATSEGVSLLTVLLAGFVRLLARHGGKDMIVGVPYAGRAIAGDAAARLVGYCTHLLPLRFRQIEGETSALLSSTRATLLDALDHADYPFAHILTDLAPRRDPARPPLVPVTFNLDRIEAIPSFGEGIVARPRALAGGFARFDLACNIVDCDGRLTIELDYDAALFSGERADRLAATYVDLLSDVAGLAKDGNSIQAHWAGGADRPEPTPLLVRSAVDDPAAPAIVLDGVLRLTRAELDRWSDAVAETISRSDKKNGPVALVLPRSELMPVAMLGCWKAARAWVPIESATPPERIAALIKLAECSLTLYAADILDLAGKTIKRDNAMPGPGDAAYILFTSGSTGLPKPVAVPHRAVAAYLDGLLARTQLPRGLSYGLVSTFAADLGLTSVLPALFHGGTLCIQSEAAARDPLLLANAARRWPIDVLKITPSHLEALLSGVPDAALFPRRLLIVGGEQTRPSLLKRLDELAPASLRVMNHYGPTETTIGVAMGEWRRDEDHVLLDVPLAGARIAVLDEDGRPVPVGAEGEIHIGGTQVALGYVGQDGETTRRFRPQPQSGIDGLLYATGDRARLHAGGALEVLGRRDDQVKVRGYRVEPAEVATVLQGVRGVRAAAVVAVEHPMRGTMLIGHVVPENEDADEATLTERLGGLLPAHMVPVRILFHDALPLTANGKLDRAALIAEDWEATPAPKPSDGSVVEASLLSVWRDLFGRSEIGVHDDFFALGGDSILGIQLVARLHQAGLRLKATDLYRNPTVAALAPLLEALGTEAEQGILSGPVPLLPSQHRWLAVGGGLHPHANLSLLLDLASDVTPDRVTQAFARLVSQHDGLRLHARHDDGAVVQEYGLVAAPQLHMLAADAPPEALDRLQALCDPCNSGVVLGWCPGTPNRLLIAIHHWLVDAVSCAILLEDLAKLLRDPQADLGPKTLSVRQWGQALVARAQSAQALDQMEFWTLCTELPPPDLPVRTTENPGGETCMGVVFTARETTEILNGPAVLAGLDVEDILLAAVTRSLETLTGEAMLYVELEGHGRVPPVDLPDPSRTIGWFTARYPAWFSVVDIDDAQAAASVREQRLALPNSGFDYGLLRWLGPNAVRDRLSRGARPEISFNYMGQIRGIADAPFVLASWRPGEPGRGKERAADMPRPHRIAIEATLEGGRLQFGLFYAEGEFDETMITAWTEHLMAVTIKLARLVPSSLSPRAAGMLNADDLAALAGDR